MSVLKLVEKAAVALGNRPHPVLLPTWRVGADVWGRLLGLRLSEPASMPATPYDHAGKVFSFMHYCLKIGLCSAQL